MNFFADTEGKISVVYHALIASSERGDSVGIDTEFYGLDIRKQSCAGGLARVHIWSLAVKRWPHKLTPRGYHQADSVVLFGEALSHPLLRSWLENPSYRKVAHNLPVDHHAIANEGVRLAGAENTISLARWVWPERARGGGYSLDTLGSEVLGLPKTESYSELFSEFVDEEITKTRRKTICSCGVEKCRLRKGHEKTRELVTEVITKKVKRRVPLESVVPGHALFTRSVDYAARDAVIALALDDVIRNKMQEEIPWPYSDPKNSFSTPTKDSSSGPTRQQSSSLSLST